jgi:hypothetical protein
VRVVVPPPPLTSGFRGAKVRAGRKPRQGLCAAVKAGRRGRRIVHPDPFDPAMIRPALLSALLFCSPALPLAAQPADPGEAPVKAPFKKGEDSLCVNDWWNRPANPIIDLKVPRDQVICFGIYTLHGGVLKLTAQLYPLFPAETREVRLELEKDGVWAEAARAKVNDLGWSATFRITGWDAGRDVKYRLRHGEAATFDGLVRKDPKDKETIVVAGLSCNSNKDRELRPEYVRNLNHHDPDLVFFAGDQSYDHLQHTAAWLKFGLAFREVFRNRPCVTIPDDHDIGQGNLWGENGRESKVSAGHDGGYFYHPEYVKMVERQQCAHLPDPFDPAPVEQGIGVYYTSLLVGGIDFAIIEDRKFKTGPQHRHPMKGPRPDHILDPAYDPKVIDTPACSYWAGGRKNSSPNGPAAAMAWR